MNTQLTRTRLTGLTVVLAGLLLISTACTRTTTPPASDDSADPPIAMTPTPTAGGASAPGPGSQVVRADYQTRYEGRTIDKHALVYLPAGYNADTSTRYDIVYLMHGAGQTADSLLGGPGQASTLATTLDRMVETEQIEPMIVVTPTFYPDDDASLDLHYAGQLDRAFPRELEDDLMPIVEGTYRTRADTPDAAGFRASRDHRAFSGFSMGGVTTWYMFLDDLDLFRYFAPMAGDCWVVQDTGGANAPEQTAARLDEAARSSGFGKDEYLIVASVGSSDGTRYQMEPQIREMRTHPRSFDTGDDGNLRFLYDDGGGHDLNSLHAQLGTALPLLFHD